MKILQIMPTDGRLRIVMETYCVRFDSSKRRSTHYGMKGYLVDAVLEGEGDITSRTSVYGPLWETPGEWSSMSHALNTKFPGSGATVVVKPRAIRLGVDGRIVECTQDERTGLLSYRSLTLMPGHVNWGARKTIAPPVISTPEYSEDMLLDMGSGFVLEYKNGTARGYELLTGLRMQDDWLEKSFAHSRSIPDFENVFYHVSTDRKCLIASPNDIWNHGSGNRIVTRFSLAGTEYLRSDYALIYRWPSAVPEVFKRYAIREDDILGSSHEGAVCIDGVCYYLVRDGNEYHLLEAGGQKKLKGPRLKDSEAITLSFTIHNPDKRELFFIWHTITPDPSRVITMDRWFYDSEQGVRVVIDLDDLFSESGKGLVPNSVVAVSD